MFTHSEKMDILKRVEKLEKITEVLNFKVNQIDRSHAVFCGEDNTKLGQTVIPFIDKYRFD